MDLLLALALSAIALLVRWPYLQDVPALTDETAEVATALAIVQDGARPLVHNDAYRGPAWAYLQAGAFAITGLQPWLPRVVAALLSALTVGATYLLARALTDRRAGLVAALLITTAFGPVALHAHVAWSNHATPLWVTLAALLTWLGQGPGRPGLVALVAAGALWGVALQSHPSALAPLLGAVGWWLAAAERRARLRSAGPWLALAACLLVMSPVILYNIAQPGASVREAGASGQPLALTLDPGTLALRLVGLVGQLGRTAAAGPLQEAGDPTPNGLSSVTDLARPAATTLYALVLLAGMAWAGWRGPRFLAWLAGATLILLPVLNRNYTSFHDQRYIGLLLPLAAAALGAWFTQRWLHAERRPRQRWGLVISLGILITFPLLSVTAYYQREAAAGRSNAVLLATVQRLAEASHSGHQHVFVDKALRDIDLGGGGDPARAFVQQLTLSRVPNDLSDAEEMRWYLAEDEASRFWLVASAATGEQLGREFGLRAWEEHGGWQVWERPATGGAPAP